MKGLHMVRSGAGLLGLAVVSALIAGCPLGTVTPDGNNTANVSDVVSKAVAVAASVGGESGFGGAMMTGYADHMPFHMGLGSDADLADAASGVTIHLSNHSEVDGTFHLSYFASHMGLDDLAQDVDVPAGDNVTIELPCAEIIGLGPLTEPGEPGCLLATGEAVPNTMAVPGFLGQDFVCGGVYECSLTPDVDDLDEDGDTTELILFSEAMEFHMMSGGPTGHMHGTGSGMMGSHMGF